MSYKTAINLIKSLINTEKKINYGAHGHHVTQGQIEKNLTKPPF